MSARTVIGALAILAGASPHVWAQESAFRSVGHVRDMAGVPVFGAMVTTSDARSQTDSTGRFSLALTRTDSTTITIRRLGFEPLTFTMLTDSLALNDLAIELQPVARSLPGMNVKEERISRVPTIERFAERRKEREGFGYFLGRDEIVAREGMPLSSLLSQARGVRLVRTNSGQALLRFARWSSKGSSCAPHVWIDGTRVRGFEIDDIPAADVEALELYANASSAPSEFSVPDFACGLVAIWTRRPALKTR